MSNCNFNSESDNDREPSSGTHHYPLIVHVKDDTFLVRPEEPIDYDAVDTITRDAFWNLYTPGADEHVLTRKLRTHPDFVPELSLVALRMHPSVEPCTNEIPDRKAGEFNNLQTVVAYIAYSKSWIGDYSLLTFGPVCVSPSYQGKGIGSALIKESITNAQRLGFTAIAIFGYPFLYQRFGFKNSKEFGITDEEGSFPKSLMVLELQPNIFKKLKNRRLENVHIDMHASDALDNNTQNTVNATTNTTTTTTATATSNNTGDGNDAESNQILGSLRCSDVFEITAEELEAVEKNLPVKEKFKTKSQEVFQMTLAMTADDDFPEGFDLRLSFDTRKID